MNQTEAQADRFIRVQVEGNSMNRAGIEDGDYLYVDLQRFPSHGDLVVAEVGDDGATVKRWVHTKRAHLRGPNWLVPESDDPQWTPIRADDTIRIIGVVVGIKRGNQPINYNIPRRRPMLFFEQRSEFK